MGRFSLPRGYYVIVGKLKLPSDTPIVQPSCYPGRYLAEEYRCEAKRLFYNRVTKVWNPSDEPLSVIDSPPSMDAVQKALEKIAGKDYLVWVASAYNVNIGDRLLMTAVGRLSRMLNEQGVKVAKPLSREAIEGFARLRPSSYVDNPYGVSSRKVRNKKARLEKPWQTLEERLGASKQLK